MILSIKFGLNFETLFWVVKLTKYLDFTYVLVSLKNDFANSY